MFKKIPRASRIWIFIFAVWGIFLTGLAGAPGLVQVSHLRGLLASKQASLAGLELEVERVAAEALRLERNRTAQEREVRRVLGYAAPDDLVFDFTSADRARELTAVLPGVSDTILN